MDLGLRGLKAILVGASKGIGRCTADILAAEGCDVAICARGAEGVEQAATALRAHGGKVEAAAVDATDPEALRGWIDSAAAALGGCDIFVCFTTAAGGPATEERWKASLETDLVAVWRGCEAATPYLKQSKAGAIVAVSSVAAIEDFFGIQPYNAMKAALINYAAALSQQLAPHGVRVNTISPGPVLFEGGSWDRIQREKPEFFQSMIGRIPLGRMSTAEEVARTIVFLASPASGSTVGTNVVVDGGITKRVQF